MYAFGSQRSTVISHTITCVFKIYFFFLSIFNLEISETNGTVRVDYLEEGIMFPHGVDIDGKLMFIIRCKLHFKSSKDPEECRKCAVYWFERMER